MTRRLRLAGALLALAALLPAAAQTPATRPPSADFLVEWRLQPADARPAPGGGVVITSDSANTGTSGFGPGAVVVGTARPAAPQALRVANGKEGMIRFDRAQTHTVYDMVWSGSSAASGSSGNTGGSVRSMSGAQGHEVVIHRVDGLRVTPHWTHGDTLSLDIALTHVAPAAVSGNVTADARARRDIDFHSTVEASLDDWITVASVGEGGDELQIRVRWRVP